MFQKNLLTGAGKLALHPSNPPLWNLFMLQNRREGKEHEAASLSKTESID